MHVVLVSTYAYPLALGLRYVSSFLKQAGHKVTVLFMCSKRDTAEADFSRPVLDDLVDRARTADLIGMGLMTNSFHRSCVLTAELRKAGVKTPIVWGGTHPTVAPRESAQVADYVCVGEGEQAMLGFVEMMQAGRDTAKACNFAYLRDGELVQNPPHPLTADLDAYPLPDYELEGHWIADQEGLVPARPELFRGAMRRYRMLSTRGCPYSCSFCNNATQMGIYREADQLSRWVRKRSTESIVTEIETIRGRFPKLEGVSFADDLFLIRSEEEIEEFVAAYERRVNLPLEFTAFPNTVTDRKIALLSRLPIALISMGIQSGSPRTLRDLYNRPTKIETIAEAVRILSAHRQPAEYHYLVANPFEPEEDVQATLRFAADHHRGPAKVRVFPLQFYPGSAMYDRARAAGVIGERHEEAYRDTYTGKRKHLKRASYLEIWLRIVLALRGMGVPSRLVHRLIDFVLHPSVRRRVDKPWFAPTSLVVYRVGRVLFKNLLYKPLLRPIAKRRARRTEKRDRFVFAAERLPSP